MVSSTKQTFTMRLRRKKSQGKRRKRQMRALSGATFPIHPVGYDPTAPDAVKGQKPGT